MGFTIRTSVASLTAQRHFSEATRAVSSSLAKLSSGMRITRAGDDAAGLAIATNLNAQIRSYNQAARNAADAISLIQTAEASLNETTNILTRLRELAMQSSSDGVGNVERGYVQNEVVQLIGEVDRIANSTEYNGVKLVDGNVVSLTFQVGIRNNPDADRITMNTVDASSATLGVAGLSLSTAILAQGALNTIDSALENISAARASLGGAGNRFQTATNTIQTASESLSAAYSRISDVDVASEMSTLSSAKIRTQASLAVLAHSNRIQKMILRLLEEPEPTTAQKGR